MAFLFGFLFWHHPYCGLGRQYMDVIGVLKERIRLSAAYKMSIKAYIVK